MRRLLLLALLIAPAAHAQTLYDAGRGLFATGLRSRVASSAYAPGAVADGQYGAGVAVRLTRRFDVGASYGAEADRPGNVSQRNGALGLGYTTGARGVGLRFDAGAYRDARRITYGYADGRGSVDDRRVALRATAFRAVKAFGGRLRLYPGVQARGELGWITREFPVEVVLAAGGTADATRFVGGYKRVGVSAGAPAYVRVYRGAHLALVPAVQLVNLGVGNSSLYSYPSRLSVNVSAGLSVRF